MTLAPISVNRRLKRRDNSALRQSDDDAGARPGATPSIGMRDRRIKIDRVLGFKRMLVTANLQRKRSFHHEHKLDPGVLMRLELFWGTS
jgi:hypothetical protein